MRRTNNPTSNNRGPLLFPAVLLPFLPATPLPNQSQTRFYRTMSKLLKTKDSSKNQSQTFRLLLFGGWAFHLPCA